MVNATEKSDSISKGKHLQGVFLVNVVFVYLYLCGSITVYCSDCVFKAEAGEM